MYRDRQPFIDEVLRLTHEMCVANAIKEALKKYPGPHPNTVRNWLPKPPPPTRPKEELFNPSKQAAVDRVWDLIEQKRMSRLAACHEVLPTVDDLAWGRMSKDIRRLYAWCDGPTGHRYAAYKLDHLAPDQMYAFYQHLGMGYPPREAFKLCRQIAA